MTRAPLDAGPQALFLDVALAGEPRARLPFRNDWGHDSWDRLCARLVSRQLDQTRLRAEDHMLAVDASWGKRDSVSGRLVGWLVTVLVDMGGKDLTFDQFAQTVCF